MLAVFLGMIMGFGVSIQTVVNTRLRSYLGSPLLASLCSFAIGTLSLYALLMIQNQAVLPDMAMMAQYPWWFWLGGALGAGWITINIFVFQQLGAVQTSILPVLGQVVMGVLIDQFGLFRTAVKTTTFIQIIGICLVLIGLIIAVALPALRRQATHPRENQENAQHHAAAWLWRALGVLAGAMIATQSAINTQLSIALSSSVQASFISFFVGTIVLLCIVLLVDRQFLRLKNAVGAGRPWWIWMGGVLGSCFVILSVILVPWIGVGQMLVLILFGQLLGSICVEQFGWLGIPQKTLQKEQIFGLLLLLTGVMIIRLIA